MSVNIRPAVMLLSCMGLCAGSLPAQTADRVAATDKNLVVNGDFEAGTEGWAALWTRDLGAGQAALDANERHSGLQAIRIEHTGDKDWSLAQTLQLGVKPGEIFELSAWVRLQGNGNATLGVVTRDANGQVLSWDYGGRTARQTKGWLPLRARFIIPAGVASIQCRLIGYGPGTIWLDDVVLTRQGNLSMLRNRDLPATLTVRNNALEVTLRTADGAMEIKDRRADRDWVQRGDESPLVVLDAKAVAGGLDARLLDPAAMREMAATVRLDEDRPECVVTLKAEGEMESAAPLAGPVRLRQGPAPDPSRQRGDQLPRRRFVPSADGVLSLRRTRPLHAVVRRDGRRGGLDGHRRNARRRGCAHPAPGRPARLGQEWQPQKGRFGPERVIRYVVLDRGGYVAMAKRYREYAKKTGLFKTLAEKRSALPAVDLLVGAVNVWCWDADAPAICRDMQSHGIRRILWSNQRPPGDLKALNDLGVLTSRYDIYQDAMNPENFAKLRWLHPDWTSDAWKNGDLLIGSDGEWVRGWQVEAKDG